MSAIAGLSISAIWHFLAILPIFSDGGAMTALLGDLSDFSFSRLPNLLNYQICNGDPGHPVPPCHSERCRSIRDGERGTPRMFAA
jgi:hypothetical protein